MVEHRAARRVEHQRVTAAEARLPDTRAVQEAVHRLAMVAAKADRQRVTAAAVAAVHLQDTVGVAKVDRQRVTVAVVAAVHLQDMVVAAKADRQRVTAAAVAAEHLQDTVAAAKVDLRQVTVAVVAAEHLQDTVVVEGRARVAVELAQAVPVPAVAARARED